MREIELQAIARYLYKMNKTEVHFTINRHGILVNFYYKGDFACVPLSNLNVEDYDDIADICVRIFTGCFEEIMRLKNKSL